MLLFLSTYFQTYRTFFPGINFGEFIKTGKEFQFQNNRIK